MTKEEKHSVMIDDVCGVLAWSRVLNPSTTFDPRGLVGSGHVIERNKVHPQVLSTSAVSPRHSACSLVQNLTG